MKPFLLMGHTRPLTMVKYNQDGDLLFSCAKEGNVCAWYTKNGELLGTYKGHNGVVWSLDVSSDSRRLATGGGDNTIRIWDVYTGKELHSLTQRNSVRHVSFSIGNGYLLVITDHRMHFLCQLLVYKVNPDGRMDEEPVCQIELQPPRIVAAEWGPLNQFILAGHEDGTLSVWDWKNKEKINSIAGAHDKAITGLQMSVDKNYFVTSSKDQRAKLWETHTLKHLKTYETDKPVNSASISPLKDHVLLGGGQEASMVTTTSARQGKFEVNFFHKIFEEEIGRVKGHFGPINTVAFAPSGRGFASGGEDGYVRLHHFDEDYYSFEIEC